MKYQFETLTEEKPKQKAPMRETFMEAWQDMYKYVNANIGKLNMQVLETAMWIEETDWGYKAPILFCEARDKAIREYGWKKPQD